MNINSILTKLDVIEKMASDTITQVTVLRKEIRGGGASLVSALTGDESFDQTRESILKRRQENRMKKRLKK